MLGVVSIKAAWSFFSGPAGRLLLIALAFVLWGFYQRGDATRECKEDQLRVELVESQRQLRIAQGIAERARDRAEETQSEMTELRGLADDLQTQLQGSGVACAIPDDVRERLLRIK